MQQGQPPVLIKRPAVLQQIVTDNDVDMTLTGSFMTLIAAMVWFLLGALIKARQTHHSSAREEPRVALNSVAGWGEYDERPVSVFAQVGGANCPAVLRDSRPRRLRETPA